MSLIEHLLGYRSFSSVSEIVKRVQQAENEAGPLFWQEKQHTNRVREQDVPYGDLPASQYFTGGSPLLIFATSRQQTWLVLAGERLYFVLDDIRRSEPQIKRSVLLDDLKFQDGRVAVDVRPKSATTGLVDVGLRRRGWLYSKRLFPHESSIKDTIQHLFAKTMARAVHPRFRWRAGVAKLLSLSDLWWRVGDCHPKLPAEPLVGSCLVYDASIPFHRLFAYFEAAPTDGLLPASRSRSIAALCFFIAAGA